MTGIRDLIVRHTSTQGGQTRPYGPTEYKGEISFAQRSTWQVDTRPIEGQEFKPVDWKDDFALIMGGLVVDSLRSAKAMDDKSREWWQYQLREWVKVGPGTWRYHVYQEYLD